MGEAFRIPRSYVITLKLGRSLNVDIVHVHKTRSYSGAVLAARSLGLPSIVDVRDLDSLHFFKGATRFIACSLLTKEMVLDAGIAPTSVHHLPVPFESKMERDLSAYDELRTQMKEGGGYILFVGDITEMKGIPELVKGFKRLRKDRPDLHLVLVGRDLMDRRLEELIEDGGAIHVLGPRSHPETMGLMEHAEVVILPSRSEGFPRTCIEALMLGTKVIFPPVVPEFKESVGDFVLSEITPNSIELKVKEVLSRDDRPDYPLERHFAERICRDVLEIYKDLLKW
jgi:glycosyltransferase involved in cell wall biosynthesis